MRFSAALICADSSLWWAVAAAAFSSSTAYSSRLCSVRKFIVCAICLRLKTLAQRAYPAPFPARSFSWMSTNRLTLGGSACTVDFLRGVCCFFPASTARISASLYPVPSPSSIRAIFFHPGALRRIAFPRRVTSQPISESIFSNSSKSVGFCSSAWSIIILSCSRWDGFALSPNHLL